MLILTPIGPTAARYYFQGQGAGRWVGRGAGSLELVGEVERRPLAALLRGCDPRDGHFLPVAKPARRRSGWDFTLAAPKSLSLLAALGDEATTASIAGAHRVAVEGVLADFEQRLLRLRRAGAPAGLAPSEGAVGAAFEHRVNASGEPHLHTHLLLMNVGRSADGRWSAIDGRWWTARPAIAALYQLALRHQLGTSGLALDWRTRPDGLADLADVPRAALRSVSSRGRRVTAARRGPADAGAGRRSRIRATSSAQTRREVGLQPWEARAAQHGFGAFEAARIAQDARTVAMDRRAGGAAGLAGASLAAAVTSHLAGQRSSFRQSDVLVALAACAPGRTDPRTAVEWAASFCAAGIPVAVGSSSASRWTTRLAQTADRRLLEHMLAPRRAGVQDVKLADAPRAPAEQATLSGPGQAAVRRLLEGGERVHVLGAPPGRTNLLAHAAVLEAAASAWESAGFLVRVNAFGSEARLRWHTLTGLESPRSGVAADVIIVDCADRRSTPDLLTLLSDIERIGAAVVLVEGGTAPRLSWMHSQGLESLGDRLGRLDPGPPPSWEPDPSSLRQGLDTSTRGITAYPTAAAAARGLVARWADEWSPRDPAVLVGLGYAEVDGLNQAARSVRVRRGEISGPALRCGGRVLQAGDRVFPLRRLAGDVARGQDLTIVEVNPARGVVSLSRAGGSRVTTVGRAQAAHLGYGYALTPGLLTGGSGRVMLLGPPDSLGPHRDRAAHCGLVAAHREATLDRLRAPPALGPGQPHSLGQAAPSTAGRRGTGRETGWGLELA